MSKPITRSCSSGNRFPMVLLMIPLHCPTCGYNLAGLPENRCPECGNRFSAEEYGSPRSPRVLVVILVTVLVLAGVPALFVAAWAGVAYVDVPGNVARSAFARIFGLTILVTFVVSGFGMGRVVARFIGPSTVFGAVAMTVLACGAACVTQLFVWVGLTIAAGGQWGFPILD